MSMLRAADAFQSFLASNGMDAKGVRVIIEFDDLDKAHRVRQCIQKEFNQMVYKTPQSSLDNPLKDIKIVGVPFSLVAKVA